MTITVENLSKKYRINPHISLEHETLKEKLTGSLKKIFSKGKNFASEEEPHDFWALKEISFSLKEGDQLAIIGKNGAGKSTLLKIISRITPPSLGRIKIEGKVASLLEVGSGFHPELTGKENIYLNGALLGMSKNEIRKKFDEIVNFSEIERFLETPVKRYSSGMFVRLAFAVAAHLEPDILIVDEALSVGDSVFKKKCLNKLEEIGKSGRTIIFVTHDMWAVKFCNRGLLLDKGQVIPTKDLNECIAKYNGSIAPSQASNRWSGYFEKEAIAIEHLELLPIEKYLATLLLRFKVLRQTEDLFVGFMIFNMDGNKIIHHKAPYEKSLGTTLSPGSYAFESEVDLTLFCDGIYRIELDVGFSDLRKIAHSEIFITFEVARPETKQGDPRNTIFARWQEKFLRLENFI